MVEGLERPYNRGVEVPPRQALQLGHCVRDGRRIDNSLAGYCDVMQGMGASRSVTYSVLRPGAERARRVRLALQ